MKNVSKKTGSPSEHAQHLAKVREALLNLHKTLVDSERVRYEKTVGTIPTPQHFLKLLTDDPWFAWMHPLSQLIVAMDEALEEKIPLTFETADALTVQARQLLTPTEYGHDYSAHYFNALQEDPDVVFAHAEAIKLVGRPVAPPESKS